MPVTRSAKKAQLANAGAKAESDAPPPQLNLSDEKPVAGDGVWEGKAGGVGFIRNTIFTLLIMIYSQLILCIWYVNKYHSGSFLAFNTEKVGIGWAMLQGDFSEFKPRGLASAHIYPSEIKPVAWQFIFTFMALSLALMMLVPGGEHRGPITANGHVPIYKANGVQCFLLHCGLFVLGGQMEFYKLSIVYDELGDILNALNTFAIFFILALNVKGRYAPSGKDGGSTGNWVCDIYWGMELYPRVFGIDIKQFTNCRWGMVFWAIATISCGSASMQRSSVTGALCEAGSTDDGCGSIAPSMLTSVVLQLIYILKFFWWETGYFNSIDIMEDRAGYYICWGCLCYLPTVYTSMTMFMVANPGSLDLTGAYAVIALGVAAIFINYDSDRQRADFRRAVTVDHITGKVTGEYSVWGSPATYIIASYTTTDGKPRKSLLLTCGYWAITRHFHYIPELSAAFFWSCGAGFGTFMPFFYTIYLTILLMDRSVRDDKRCSDKYTDYWAEYCKLVPSKIFPGIF